ncbi:class I SAM-dependent methyltransferase [Flavitalea flava]
MNTQQFDTLCHPGDKEEKLAGWLMPLKSRQQNEWAIERLNIQPYQHLLEVGYGTGITLQEVARKLKVGFLAGIDDSIAMYRQAYGRNKQFIQRQLLQLHIGNLNELSYPPYYFHTIYGTNIHFAWKEPELEYMRLNNLLKNRGKLVMILQSRTTRKEEAFRQAAEKMRQDFIGSGLSEVSIEYGDRYPGIVAAVTGIKP